MRDHPFNQLLKHFLLFCIAFILFVTTAPIGFLYALIRQLFFKSISSLSVFLLQVALALDIAGNILMQHVLNDALLIKNQNTHNFGNTKETISSVLGKNSLTQTLNAAGRGLNRFLNWLDKNHTLNSIMYDIKTGKWVVKH
jgi:8-oxo-dGTP diphosphatase